MTIPHRHAPATPALRPLALAIATLCLPPLALAAGPAALPGGLQVVQGQASLATAGNRLTVTNSANALLNWQQFSIGADQAVHFAQPSAASKVLNRVVGREPSAILGSLSSNGQVWLLNPNGVLFGAGARVDVAGLVASTLRLDDADWAAGRLNLSGSADGAFGSTASVVINQGVLRTVNGGRVLLLGSGSVRNEGLIEAPDGQVLLAAGRSVELVDSGLPNLAVKLTAPQGEAVNLGSLLAGSGRVDLQAALVNQQGIVRADSLGSGRGGEVVLSASQGLNLAAGSQTSADGAAGGRVSVDGGTGTTLVTGSVSATGSHAAGGEVALLGRQVGLLDGAAVDASGAAGGGSVRVGGGLQGRDAAYRNAEAVFMAPGATIRADATARGEGGRVVLWSDQATRVYGSLSAQGGPSGGNGGFIETSGGWLDARPLSVRAGAPAGKVGQWLLDPYSITITNGGSEQNISPGPDFSSTGSPSLIVSGTIVNALEMNDVTVTTGPSGTDPDVGNITMTSAHISFSALDPLARPVGRLTLTANNNIDITDSILDAFSGPFHVDLNAGGAVSINSSLTGQRTSISNKGGAVTIRASSVTITNSTIDTSKSGDPLAAAAPPSPGTILVAADNITLGAGALLSSPATGRAISLQGRVTNTAMQSFDNQAGATVLQAPNGRWLVHVVDSEGASVFSPGGLAADFWQYNALPDNELPATQPGHGFRFAAAPVLGVSGFQRVYDGTTTIDQDALLSNLTGLRGGLTLVGAAAFSDKNVAAAVPLILAETAGRPVMTTDGKPVYGYQVDPNLTGAITQRTLGVSGLSAADKVYDGSTAATVTGFSLANVVPGDQVEAIGSGSFDTADVGTAKLVLATAVGLTGAAAGNYNLDPLFSLGRSGFDHPRPLTMTNVVVADKVYDQGTAASVTSWTLSGLVGTEQVNTGPASGQFSSAGVGSGKAVQTTFSLLPGLGGANYTVADPAGTATASITPRPLTVSGVTVADKPYDGNTAATVTGWSLSNVLSGDQVQVGAGTGQFSSPTAGTAKPVLATATSLSGPDAGNYSLGLASQAGSAAITRRWLTLTGVTVADKVYDGGTAATVTDWSLANVVPGDQVQVGSGGGNFSSAGVGTDKPVLAVAGSLTGTAAGNYQLSNPSQFGRAAITPRSLTMADVVVADKVYDGGTAASVSSWTVAGLVANDQVNLGPASGQFQSPGVGSGKPVLTGFTLLPGLAGGNYVAASPAGSATASITPRPLTLTGATVADKVYDGGTGATVTGWSLANGVTGDEVQVSAGRAQFSEPGVGAGKPVRATATELGGADAPNYRLAVASLTTSAAITAAPLQYLADPARALQGQPLPPLSGTVTGFVNGETLAGATTGSLRFDTPASPESAPGRYAIDGSGLAAANYRFSQAPSNATALTLLAPEPPARTEPPINPYVTQTAVATVLPTPEASSPTSGRALDAMPALLGTGSTPAFDSLDLDSLSPATVAAMLAARSEYKRAVFQQALAQLELDPARADALPCETLQQADAGQCLATGPLGGARLLDRAGGAAPPAGGAPAAAPPAAPSAAAAAPATPPAAAAAQAAARAAAVAAARPPQPVVDLPARRPVKVSALPQIRRKIALVIGIDQYSDQRIPRLGNAVNDARAVAAALEANLGYETVVLANANRSGVFRALNQLVAQAAPADSVLVYYAGHGERSEKSGLGYWQPSDADPTRPETWISNTDIDRVLRQMPASQVAMISDSCFSGSLVSGERIRGATGPQDPAALLGRRAAVVMTSGGNEPVFDSGKNGHSPFAWSLMQSLQQVSSWKAGSSVFEQVRFAVARQLPQRPQYAAAPNAGHQAGADFLFERRQLEGVVK